MMGFPGVGEEDSSLASIFADENEEKMSEIPDRLPSGTRKSRQIYVVRWRE
jgi:hypothetical protein